MERKKLVGLSLQPAANRTFSQVKKKMFNLKLHKKKIKKNIKPPSCTHRRQTGQVLTYAAAVMGGFTNGCELGLTPKLNFKGSRQHTPQGTKNDGEKLLKLYLLCFGHHRPCSVRGSLFISENVCD